MSLDSPLSTVRRLGAEQATGELICAVGDLEVHVYLQQGRVAWATSSAARFAFGRELVRRCSIDLATLQELVEDCRRNRRPLGETLISWNLASAEDVRESLRLQIRDALGTLSGRTGAPTLFLERGVQYLAYERTLTFELEELLDRPSSFPPGPLGDEDPSRVVDRLFEDVPEIRWAEVLRGDEVLAARPTSRPRDRPTLQLAALAFGDDVDVAVVRSGAGTTIGIAREDDTSLWLGLGADARLGSVFGALGDLLPAARPTDTIRHPEIVVDGPTCTACEPVLHDVLTRWVDAEAACVLHAGTPMVVHRRGVDPALFRALALRRAPMLSVGEEGARPADREPAFASGSRSIAVGRHASWSLATPVPDDSTRVLWLAVSRQASQGLAWALLVATARQIARASCDGAPND